MGRQSVHRERILDAATTLFRDRGYAATGIGDILAASGAPRGSLYHHFPGGKEALGAEAVARAGAVVTVTLEAIATRTDSGTAFLTAYFELLAGWLQQSGYRSGCPIAVTLLETTSHSEPIRAAGGQALQAWHRTIEAVLASDGRGPDFTGPLASFTISAVEGALLQARVLQSRRPLDDALAALLSLLNAPVLNVP